MVEKYRDKGEQCIYYMMQQLNKMLTSIFQ